MTDHCAIDQDQFAIERELAKQTPSAFEAAEAIYNNGGNSKSYAELFLAMPLPETFEKDTLVTGKTEDGEEVIGKLLDTYPQGTIQINVQYKTNDDQEHHVLCKVGALPLDVRVTTGCFTAAGTITIGDRNIQYQYIPATQNRNDRTIAEFSREAAEKMRLSCDGCPYKDHSYFYKYYGVDDYGDKWVTAALNGMATSFLRGNADFSIFGFEGRVEAAKKGMVFFNIFMYVIREFEDALDDCEKGCKLEECNDDPVHAWDEGVCFYTGSIEGEDGMDDGKLLHQLADKRCIDFRTCGENGDDTEGRAKLNYDLLKLFSLGKYQLQLKECSAARGTLSQITRLMYVPFIQGTLRYAYKVGVLNEGEKSAAEGATFAAAILPRVHAAKPDAAESIYNNMGVGASNTDFAAVKLALESVYIDLGISCADVGGLWNEAVEDYWEGAEPCGPIDAIDDQDVLIISIVGALVGVIFVCMLAACFARTQIKSKSPVKPAPEQPELECAPDAELS